MLKGQVFETITTQDAVNTRQTILRNIFGKELFSSAAISATILVDELFNYIDADVQLQIERKLFHPEMIPTWSIQQSGCVNTTQQRWQRLS